MNFQRSPEAISRENILKLFQIKHSCLRKPDGAVILGVAKPQQYPLSFYVNAFNDPEVTRYLKVENFNPRQYISRMNGRLGDYFGSLHDALYQIYYCNREGPIGHVSLNNINWNELSLEVGIVVARDFMGQGIGTEALALVLEKLREQEFKTVHAKVRTGNERSRRLFTRQFGEEKSKDGSYHYFELDLLT